MRADRCSSRRTSRRRRGSVRCHHHHCRLPVHGREAGHTGRRRPAWLNVILRFRRQPESVCRPRGQPNRRTGTIRRGSFDALHERHGPAVGRPLRILDGPDPIMIGRTESCSGAPAPVADTAVIASRVPVHQARPASGDWRRRDDLCANIVLDTFPLTSERPVRLRSATR